ncbi:hypothetical protein Vafri_9215, partial [Volvox africanus]
PCEVELTLHRYLTSLAGVGGGVAALTNGQPSLESHVLRTGLAPDGASRVFHLDGRIRTAQQIKQFLAALGLVLDSGTAAATAPRVIRQAQVTALADNNDPAVLAALVGSASGLVRWREETKKGREELEGTRAALREIRANVERLQAAVRDDEERLAAASRLASLEVAAAVAGGELADALTRWVQGIQDETRRLEEAVEAAAAEHQQLV